MRNKLRYDPLMSRPSTLNNLGICALLVILAGVCSPSTAGASSVERVSKPAAALRGVVGGYHWLTEVRHGKKAGASPCVSVSLFKAERGATVGKNTLCGSVSPFPLLVEESAESGQATRSIVGMGFAADVAKVRIVLRGRVARTVALHSLTKSEAMKGHVPALRYGAFAYSGSTCVVRIIPYHRDSAGWQGPGFRGNCGR